MDSIGISIITGVLSGILSGAIVYLFTKNRENKYQTYYFLVDYLCRSMEEMKIEVPLDVSRYASKVGDRNSTWGKAIYTIIEERRKYIITDDEIPQEYKMLSNSIIVAFSELNKWAKKNGLNVKEDNNIIKN